MFDSGKDFRKNRPLSLLELAAARPALGEDAALRHERARLRRERRPSPLLDAPQLPVENDVDPPSPTRRLRGGIGGGEAKVVEPAIEPAQENLPPAAEMPLEWADEADAAIPVRAASARKGPLLPGGARRIILSFTLAGAVLGAGLALALPKSYVAAGEMLIDPGEAGFALVDNQLRVLRSGTMLDAVADRLNLAADPEFNGEGALAGLRDIVAGDGAAAMESRRRHVVNALAGAVRAERVGNSTVVALSVESADPQKSALIANTISELFVAGFGHAPANAGEAAGEMSSRLAGLRIAVEEAERAVETYKAEHGLVDAQGRPIAEDEMVRLAGQLSDAQARTVELNARAASTREADVDSIVTGSLPEQYASPTLSELRARHAELKQQLDRASVKLGPRHPERLAAQAEMEGARQEIASELRRVASALQIELRRAVQQEQELAARLAEMKTRQGDGGDERVALRELEREAGARRAAYEQALRMMASGGPAAGSVSMISRAEPPLRASGPPLAGFSLAGGLAGLLAGLGYAGWRRPREAENETEWQASETGQEADKEADPMYPYPPYAPQAGNAQQPYPQPASYPAGHVQPAPAQWQQAAQPPLPAPGWPAASYPAPVAPYPAPSHAAMPQPMMMPMPAPYDPWAHLRAYAAPPPPPAYAAPAYAPPPVQTVIYVPMPAPAQTAPVPVAAGPKERREHHEAARHAFVDERTDAAIEEIRRSLREFREAIEDYAGDHDQPRRYGT